MAPWMQYGTTHYEVGSSNPGKITVQMVADALSRLNRFTGHGTAYSVARHSVFVSRLLDMSTEVAMYGLIHDAHETVINDICWPVKQALGPAARAEFDAIEAAADKALFRVFGMPWPMPEEIAKQVKMADWIAVATEKRDLLPACDRKWDMLKEPAHHRHVKKTSSAEADAAEFMSRYRVLKGIPHHNVKTEDCGDE
jgi:5'-deoxynucleotidase YfbR-like HD superfamily hydrolase